MMEEYTKSVLENLKTKFIFMQNEIVNLIFPKPKGGQMPLLAPPCGRP